LTPSESTQVSSIAQTTRVALQRYRSFFTQLLGLRSFFDRLSDVIPRANAS
jgi:hypothetical protein